MLDRGPVYEPEMKDSSPVYEVTDNFDNLDVVGAIVLDPEQKRILLVRRLLEEFDKNGKLIEVPKHLRNKFSSSGKVLLALPSGSGPLSDLPYDPDESVRKEIRNETGSYPALLEKFHTYKRIDIPNAKKVGFYIAEMSPGSINLTNPNKNPPGFFLIEWFGTRITLPYEEQNRVVLDYLRERVGKSL